MTPEDPTELLGSPDSIPYLGLRTAQAKPDNPGATADTGPHNSAGSPLYRLNIWHMMWGPMISARPGSKDEPKWREACIFENVFSIIRVDCHAHPVPHTNRSLRLTEGGRVLSTRHDTRLCLPEGRDLLGPCSMAR